MLTFKDLFIFSYGAYLLFLVWISQETEFFSCKAPARIWMILPYNDFEWECLKTNVFGFCNDVYDEAKSIF